MRLRLATWNVHAGVGRGGRRDLGRTAAVLRELGADVIGLQEVGTGTEEGHHEPQWPYLARAAGMRGIPGPTLVRGGGPFGNALLTRFPVVEVRSVDLRVPGREPRAALIAALRMVDRTWLVVVTHLGLRVRERAEQALRLVRALPEVDTPTVVLADVNAFVPFSPALRRLRRRFGRPLSAPSFPAQLPLLPLDRIWIRPREGPVRVWVHASSLARRASDHLPVCAELAVDGR